ncbi:hypothetical protein ACLOJK_026954 [Asimina triloba]
MAARAAPSKAEHEPIELDQRPTDAMARSCRCVVRRSSAPTDNPRNPSKIQALASVQGWPIHELPQKSAPKRASHEQSSSIDPSRAGSLHRGKRLRLHRSTAEQASSNRTLFHLADRQQVNAQIHQRAPIEIHLRIQLCPDGKSAATCSVREHGPSMESSSDPSSMHAIRVRQCPWHHPAGHSHTDAANHGQQVRIHISWNAIQQAAN